MPNKFFLSAVVAGLGLLGPAVSHADIVNWTGFYFGAGGGYGSQAVSVAGVSGLRPAGPVGDVEGGYQHQFGRVVVGAEVDGFPLSALPGNALNNCPVSICGGYPFKLDTRAKTEWAVGAEGKLGYAFGNDGRWLAYGAGGYHTEREHVANTVITPFGKMASAQDVSGSGWYTSVGLDYALTRHLSLGFKYDYVPSDFAAIHARTATNLYLMHADVRF